MLDPHTPPVGSAGILRQPWLCLGLVCAGARGARRGAGGAGTGLPQVALPVKKNSEKQQLQPSFLWIPFPFYSPFEVALTLDLTPTPSPSAQLWPEF